MNELAVDGAAPVRSTAFPTWPVFGADEIAAACEVLRSGRVNRWTGEHGAAFDAEFAAAAGCHWAVSVANGTLALEIALRALGVSAGDEVIVPAATFVATASAVVQCGARPVFADVDLRTQCLPVEAVERVRTPRTVAVIAVHLAGHPAPADELATYAHDRGLWLVEDCAQAHGARLGGRGVGTFGHVATWSFCQDKIITTGGEGGAVTTDDAALARRCWEIKDHGKSWQRWTESSSPGAFRWLHERIGTNARMTELQAVIGRVQLSKMDGWVKRRRANAAFLHDQLSGIDALRLLIPEPGVEHSYYRYYAHVRPERLRPGWDRDRIAAALLAEGVPSGAGGCSEVYREGAFRRGNRARLPHAAQLGRTSLVLPVHPALAQPDLVDVVTAVRRVFAGAQR
ncbi:DegT/DnrJ/EryC1/StrS aminotransferase family protein [Saccharopolyspora sp. HNM0983]|uniref:DegT/DnrJ/EryC1/StrS aminotransferase family protein n=1 Tax=Saccharopolyspora montiporae TaxID=2781240 RepID=A0A929BCV0_9PSEU|nr:DegT/DnrJ/EryC1/StrS aminotransferase family protein [Saccharopolyspora sp. HNM0983]MBE9376501.1 DegT/DnrJ/EryC1/StrS aminotransferase family protein [Saccharopolyspora sp. HNM0983]